jgi:hypothetical protein
MAASSKAGRFIIAFSEECRQSINEPELMQWKYQFIADQPVQREGADVRRLQWNADNQIF